ncbi:Ig-like domain-containing protein [Mycetocola tolaasinivorans]|nr:Ig-like domain-containing protein [Mycetocola tolaasinivorans]
MATLNDAGTMETEIMYVIDSIPPAVPVITNPPTGSPTNNNTPTVSGTGEDESTVEVRNSADATLCSSPVTNGTWSCTLTTALSDGDHTLEPVAFDEATNTSRGTPITITVLTALPEAPVITAPETGLVTNETTPTVSGTGPNGVTVEVRGSGGDVLCSAAVSGGTWSCTLETALAAGTYTLTPVSVDAATNERAGTAISITVDLTPPAKPVITSPETGFVTKDVKPTISGTAGNGSAIEVRSGGTLICSATVSDGAWECQPTADLAEGDYTLVATAKSVAGNTTASDPVSITIDTTPPAIPVISSPVDGTETNVQKPEISGTGEAGSTVTVSSTAGPVCSATVLPAGTWSCIPTTDLSEGTHTLTPTATDTAGNPAIGAAVSIVIDLTPPTVPVITSPTNGHITNEVRPTISGSGENGSTVTVRDGVVAVCTSPVTNGTWSCVPTADLSEGSHAFTPSATDAAGNSSEGQPVTITVDTTAPAVPVINAPLNGAAISELNPTISGGGENGSTVTVLSGTTVVCSAVVVAGIWSCEPETDLSEGEHTLTPVATDAANNTATGVAITITVDTTPPTVPVITSPQSGNATNEATPTISGTGENGSTVTVREGSTVICSAVVSGGVWSCAPTTNLSDGSHSLIPTARDAAGNEAEGAAVTLTVDTTPPTVPVITSPTDGHVTNEVTPTISGTGENGSTVELRHSVSATQRAAETVLCSAVVEGGTWSCEPTEELADGLHTLVPVASDAVGNTSTGAAVSFTILTVKPAAPVITSPVSGTSVNTAKPTFAGTGEDGTTVQVRDANERILCSAEVRNGRWSCESTVELPEAAYALTPVALDIAKNETAGAPVRITVDTTPPAPTTDITCIVDEAGMVACEGDGDEGDTIIITDGDGNTVCTVIIPEGGHWSCIGGPVTKFPIGVETIDEAGNSGGVTILPAPPVITSPVSGSAIGTATPTFSGTGTAGHDLTIVDENGDTVCSTTVKADGTWSCTITQTQEDGEHEYLPVSTAEDGTVFAGAPVRLTVDTEAPAPVTGAECVANADGTVTCSGTAEPGSTITITDAEGNTVCEAVADETGAWSCTSTGPVDLDELTITVTDAAGNVSPSITVGVGNRPTTPTPSPTPVTPTPTPVTPTPQPSPGGELVSTGSDYASLGAMAIVTMLLIGSGLFLRNRRTGQKN